MQNKLFVFSCGAGHPSSVDCMVAYDNDTLVTGSWDGLLRVVNILPNRMLGIVGEHSDFPVERVALSSTQLLMASASHDAAVRIWDVAALAEPDGKQEEDAVVRHCPFRIDCKIGSCGLFSALRWAHIYARLNYARSAAG